MCVIRCGANANTAASAKSIARERSFALRWLVMRTRIRYLQYASAVALSVQFGSLGACGYIERTGTAADASANGGLDASGDAAGCDAPNGKCSGADSLCTLAVGAEPSGVAPCLVADSVRDYSLVQGRNAWYYGLWRRSDDADKLYRGTSAEFTLMQLYENSWRTPDYAPMPSPQFSWAMINAEYEHPALAHELMPVRRWVSPGQGPAEIEVTFAKSDASGGDGVGCRLYVDGILQSEGEIEGTDGVGKTLTSRVHLNLRSSVDVLLDFRQTDAADSTRLHVIVKGL